MAVVRSEGQLAAIHRPYLPTGYTTGGVALYGEMFADYESIYRTQPAVRRVVGFLARNIAQLGLHAYRRLSDTDRQRLSGHPVTDLIARPNGWTTRYRLFDSLINDLGIYDQAFWVKVPDAGGLRVVRIPPKRMLVGGDDWLRPTAYRILGNKASLDVDPSQVVHFRGYNPDDARQGLSPMETLRRLLAEEQAMGEYREGLWRKGARVEMVLARPVGAPKMSPDARERFLAQFESRHAGPAGSGVVALLEEGMTVSQASFTAKDAQYLEARKLNTEEVAAAYHVPLPMVGILDHATFSNITEQHKQLYQDTLGPRLVEIEEELGLQLLPDLPDSSDVYVEFNLAEKLRGSFEEQATQLQTAVGGPWLTRNEARARVNLPALPGGDDLVVPLNVVTGGQASPTDSAPKALRPRLKSLPAAAVDGALTAHRDALLEHFSAQRAAAADGDDLVGDEWDVSLSDLLLPLATGLADLVGTAAADRLGGTWTGAVAAAYLALNALFAARNINTSTAQQYAAATAGDTVDEFWQHTTTSRADEAAAGRVAAVGNFADHEGSKQAGATQKTWNVNSRHPRPSHAAVSGQTVGIDEEFSLGGRWPHDHKLGVDDVAGCSCTLSYSMEA